MCQTVSYLCARASSQPCSEPWFLLCSERLILTKCKIRCSTVLILPILTIRRIHLLIKHLCSNDTKNPSLNHMYKHAILTKYKNDLSIIHITAILFGIFLLMMLKTPLFTRRETPT